MRELWMMRVVNQLLEIGEVISIGRDESEIERLIWGWEREARIIHRAPCNKIDGVHVGATWWIRLNDLCMAAMPYWMWCFVVGVVQQQSTEDDPSEHTQWHTQSTGVPRHWNYLQFTRVLAGVQLSTDVCNEPAGEVQPLVKQAA